eukprot:COSAG06_NODE_4429_length_4277_cov_3.529201_3_plen_74_part_00
MKGAHGAGSLSQNAPSARGGSGRPAACVRPSSGQREVTQRIEWSRAVYATVPGDKWLLATSGFRPARRRGVTV